MLLLAASVPAFAQDRTDGATYAEPPKNEFWEKMQKENKVYYEQKKEPAKRLTMDLRRH